MGCSSSKDADQPKKTIIIQQQEPVQHIIPIDNSSVINEKRRVQIEEEDRYRKDAIERAEAKKREATLKTPPRSNKEKHSKVLAHVDDKYKNLQANFILLNENLRKNDKEEKTLPIINQTIKNDGKDIENSLEDLQSQSFPNDKEYSKELKKAVRVSKNLDLEYQGLKKNTKKYPEYKKNVLGLLHDQYPDLFDESRTQEESMRRSVSPPRPEIRNISTRIDPPPRNVGERPIMFRDDPLVRVGDSLPPQPIIAATFDDPFDREMAAVMEKQRDDAAFELEAAVKEFERLKMDVNVLKTRQDNLQKDYRATQQEIKELQNANRQIQNLNGTIGKENGSFNENKTEVLRKHEHTKQACAALEKELAELRALYVQRVAESDLMDQEHQLRVTQMEYEIKRKQDDAREIDMSRKEEDVRLREDERRYQDDERRREELERRRIDIERKRQDDERRRVEADRIHKEEVRRVEAKIQEVDRMRRNLALEPVVPIVSDFSVSVPIVRDVRSSVHVSPVKTMPVVLPPIVDGREIEMRLQEDVRRIKMMNEEADVRRAHMMHQLNQPVIIETSAPVAVQYSAPVGFNDIMLPNKYSNMSVENLNPVVVLEPHTHNFVNHETIVPIVGGGRRSIHAEHPKVEIANSALEMARRARMGNDRHQLAAVMDHTRLEAQNVPIAYQSGFGY